MELKSMPAHGPFLHGFGQPQPGGHKTRYICANRSEGKEGCTSYADMGQRNINAGRIPRCRCDIRMVPLKEPPKRGRKK